MNPFRGFFRRGIIRPPQAANFPPVQNPAGPSGCPQEARYGPRSALYAASQAGARSRISPHFFIPIGKQKHQTIRFPIPSPLNKTSQAGFLLHRIRQLFSN
jgi:hypothetical protein